MSTIQIDADDDDKGHERDDDAVLLFGVLTQLCELVEVDDEGQ